MYYVRSWFGTVDQKDAKGGDKKGAAAPANQAPKKGAKDGNYETLARVQAAGVEASKKQGGGGVAANAKPVPSPNKAAKPASHEPPYQKIPGLGDCKTAKELKGAPAAKSVAPTTQTVKTATPYNDGNYETLSSLGGFGNDKKK